MKPAPADWPRISSSLFYDDPARAIDWLRDAFGFTVRVKIESAPGVIEHSELELGGGLVMVAGTGKEHRVSPRSTGGGVTQTLYIYVDDVEAHCQRAREHGAIIDTAPTTHDYGEEWFSDRSYGCTDLEGHKWGFAQRLRDAPDALAKKS